MRIACLHTADSNIAVFETALQDLSVERIVLKPLVRADLLARAEAARGLTPSIEHDTVRALRSLSGEADTVILTCSTLGPSVTGAQARIPAPTLRVDQALAEKAIESGGTVAVLYAVETTLEPTRRLFEAATRKTGAQIRMDLVPGAWAIFKAGHRDRYEAMVAAAADRGFSGWNWDGGAGPGLHGRSRQTLPCRNTSDQPGCRVDGRGSGDC